MSNQRHYDSVSVQLYIPSSDVVLLAGAEGKAELSENSRSPREECPDLCCLQQRATKSKAAEYDIEAAIAA
jgi:hypothetical protein